MFSRFLIPFSSHQQCVRVPDSPPPCQYLAVFSYFSHVSVCEGVFHCVFKIFIYLFIYSAAPSLSCGLWNLSVLHHSGSFVAMHGLASCGVWAR